MFNTLVNLTQFSALDWLTTNLHHSIYYLAFYFMFKTISSIIKVMIQANGSLLTIGSVVNADLQYYTLYLTMKGRGTHMTVWDIMSGLHAK